MKTSDIIKCLKDSDNLYRSYLRTLKLLLEEILITQDIHFAVIQGRIKDERSIIDNCIDDLYKGKDIENIFQIADLVGCRIVFYLEEDLVTFINIFRKEFSVLEEANMETTDRYQGYHATCRLTELRLKLAEYEKYKGIPFELQLTTVLHHGWNELDHDIFYKDKEKIEKTYKALFNKLRDESRQIMQAYIIPAQQAWEGLVKDYKSASKNSRIYSLEYLSTLSSLKDNNQIYHAISEIKEKSYIVGTPEKINVRSILDVFFEIIKKSKSNRLRKERSFFKRSFQGKNYVDITQVILDLTKHLFYIQPTLVIKFLLKIYLLTNDGTIRNYINKLVFDLASYNNDILNKYGFFVQYKFLKVFKGLTVNERVEIIELICETSKAVFAREFYGSKDFFDENEKAIKMTMTNYSFKKDNVNYIELKKQYIGLLKNLFKYTKNFEQRHLLIEALSNNLGSDNSEEVIKFLLKNSSVDSSVELLSKIEDVLSRSRDEKLLDKFNAKVGNHKIYQKFRILVGYDRNFDLKMSWAESEEFRNKEIDKLISLYGSDLKGEQFIHNLIQVTTSSFEKINDPSAYRYYYAFLEKIVSKHVDLGIKLLKNKKNTPTGILTSMLVGILNSNISFTRKKEVVIKDLKLDSKTLLALAFAVQKIKNKKIRLFIVSKVVNESIKLSSVRECVQIYTSVLYSFGFSETSHLPLYFKMFTFLSSHNSHDWVRSFYGARGKEKTIFDVFKIKEWDKFLILYVKKKNIDYHDNYILDILVEKYPKKVLQFFKDRIIYENTLKERDGYAAVPFSDARLQEIFNKHEHQFLDEIFKWNKQFDNWRVAHIMHDFYPKIDGYLEKKIRTIIDIRNKKIWKEQVASLFPWYESHDIEKVIEYTINKFKKDEEIWKECFSHLLNPGSVSGSAGEPILANAIEKKVERVKAWKQNSKKMKEFVQKFEELAKKKIESEKISHNKEMLEHKRMYS